LLPFEADPGNCSFSTSSLVIWSMRIPTIFVCSNSRQPFPSSPHGSNSCVPPNEHAIDEFAAWHCSEPRLTFNKAVIVRFRFQLEKPGLSPWDDQRANGGGSIVWRWVPGPLVV
jgi:hypothetical protein